MQKKYGYVALAVVVLVAAGWLVWRAKSPATSHYKYLTVDSEGTVTKSIAPLPQDALSKIPNDQMRMFVFGTDPVVVNGSTTTDSATGKTWEVMTIKVSDAPADIFEQYTEYFKALNSAGFTTKKNGDERELTAQSGSYLYVISVNPIPNESGSTVFVSRTNMFK